MLQPEKGTEGRTLQIRATLFLVLFVGVLIVSLITWKAPQLQLSVLASTNTPAATVVVVQRKNTVVTIGNMPPIANVDARLTKIGDQNLLELKFPNGGKFTAQFIGDLPEDFSMKQYALGGQAFTYLWNTDGSNQLMTHGVLPVIVFQGNYTFMVPTKSGKPVKLFIDF